MIRLAHKTIIVIFLALQLLNFPLMGDAQAANESNDTRKKAWALYDKGVKAYLKQQNEPSTKTLRDVEKIFLDARALVNTDTDALRYTNKEQRLIHGTGRWAKFKIATIPYTKRYQPNLYITRIRSKIPPKPWLVCMAIKSGDRTHLEVTLANRGDSSLETFKATLSSEKTQAPDPLLFEQLAPGKTATETCWLPGHLSDNPLTLHSEERYDFSIPPVSIKGEM